MEVLTYLYSHENDEIDNEGYECDDPRESGAQRGDPEPKAMGDGGDEEVEECEEAGDGVEDEGFCEVVLGGDGDVGRLGEDLADVIPYRPRTTVVLGAGLVWLELQNIRND